MEALENVEKYVQSCSVCIVDFEQVNVSLVVSLLLTLNIAQDSTHLVFLSLNWYFPYLKTRTCFKFPKSPRYQWWRTFIVTFEQVLSTRSSHGHDSRGNFVEDINSVNSLPVWKQFTPRNSHKFYRKNLVLMPVGNKRLYVLK